MKKNASLPRKKASGGQVIALLRDVILRLHDTEAFESLNAGFHHRGGERHAGLRLLKNPPPKISSPDNRPGLGRIPRTSRLIPSARFHFLTRCAFS